MNNADEQIAAILARFGEPADGSIWQVEGQAFTHHRTLERIAAQARITFDPPTVLRAERDEAVLLVVGRMGERTEWSIGEALVDMNYHVPGSEPAYVYALAEKRAKDRVILKLIGLPDVVSSEEPHAVESHPSSSNENTPAADLGMEPSIVVELKPKLDGVETVEAVIALMRGVETQQSLAGLAPEWMDEVRGYAKARMVALGWTPKQAA
jgi:hypothetical protein